MIETSTGIENSIEFKKKRLVENENVIDAMTKRITELKLENVDLAEDIHNKR